MVFKFKQRIGSRAQVMNGTAKITGGGLTKKHLKYNKRGRIVSKKASRLAKKNNRLVNAGYITKKGVFGVIKKGGMNNNIIDTENKEKEKIKEEETVIFDIFKRIKGEKIIIDILDDIDNKNFHLAIIKFKEGISLLGESEFNKLYTIMDGKRKEEKRMKEIEEKEGMNNNIIDAENNIAENNITENNIEKAGGLILEMLNNIDSGNIKQSNIKKKEAISLLGKTKYLLLLQSIKEEKIEDEIEEREEREKIKSFGIITKFLKKTHNYKEKKRLQFPILSNIIPQIYNKTKNTSFYITAHGNLMSDNYFFCPSNLIIVNVTSPGYYAFSSKYMQNQKAIQYLRNLKNNTKIPVIKHNGHTYNINLRIFNPGDIINDISLTFDDIDKYCGIVPLEPPIPGFKIGDPNKLSKKHIKTGLINWSFINEKSPINKLSNIVKVFKKNKDTNYLLVVGSCQCVEDDNGKLKLGHRLKNVRNNLMQYSLLDLFKKKLNCTTFLTKQINNKKGTISERALDLSSTSRKQNQSCYHEIIQKLNIKIDRTNNNNKSVIILQLNKLIANYEDSNIFESNDIKTILELLDDKIINE